MDEDDDFWGISAALSTKESPSALGSWVGMVSKVEGRDKLLKFVQFAARFFKWRCLGVGDAAAAASWHGLFSSVQEGRKSVRVLKGINKINQAFDEVPNAATTYEKGLVAGMHFGLAMHWHFDYLAHCHRTKFIRFSDARYRRIFRTPGFFWSVGNICQVLLGVHVLQSAARQLVDIRTKLEAAVGEAAEELKSQLKALQVARFRGWLLVLKGFADVFTSVSMAGPEIQKRFPKIFGWLNDGTVGIAGAISATCVMFNNYPDRTGRTAKVQTHQSERNGAAAVFAIMQLSTILGASPALGANV